MLVKKIIHSNAVEDKERAKRNLIHEAKVLLALGDHERLPLFFGIVTKNEPLCLVTQFQREWLQYNSSPSLKDRQTYTCGLH